MDRGSRIYVTSRKIDKARLILRKSARTALMTAAWEACVSGSSAPKKAAGIRRVKVLP
jgi:hypothetical protein